MKIQITAIELRDKDDMIDQEKVGQIAESFKNNGQFHPVILQSVNGNYKVSAGELRVRAAKFLGWTEVEAEVRNITDEESKEIGIQENLRRLNLSWYEEVELVKQYHELHQAKIGVGKPGRPDTVAGKRPAWTIEDTARALGRSMGGVSQDIRVAEQVRLDPSLRGIKDKATATRIIRQRVQAAETEAEHGLPSRTREFRNREMLLGSAAQLLSYYPENTFDGCITDPPWIKFYDKSLTQDAETLPVFRELFRVLKYNTLLYAFVGIDDFVFYQRELPKIGFRVSGVPLIWVKTKHLSRRAGHQWEYGRNFEFILLAAKGDPVLTHATVPEATITCAVVPSASLIHPNEKPRDLIVRLANDCSHPGAIFVEPFGGSFAHVDALDSIDRKWVAIERDPTFYANGVRRIHASIERRKEK